MNTLQRWLGNACGERPMRPPFIVQFCALLLVLLAAPAAAQILPQGHRFYGETVGSALAREIAVGNGEVWIIGNEPTGGGNYNVMHLVGDHFERVAGQAVKIAVDGEGVPWVITAQNTIWRFDPSRRRGWDRKPGLATEIAAAGSEVWAIGVDANDPDKDIARWNGARWVGVPGRGAKISVTANGTAYVVNSRGNLYRRTTASTTGFDRLADGVNQVNATAYLPGSPASDEIVVVTTTTGKVLTMAGDAWYGSNGDSDVGLGQGPALALRVARDAARSLRVYAIHGGTPYGQAGPVIIGEPNEDETYAAPVVAQANPAPATLGYFIPAQAIDGEAARSDIYSTYQPPAWLKKVSRNWMSWLPDSTPLHKLSIPGTHDSEALWTGGEDVLNRVAITQIWTTKEQLNAGVRFFDYRTSSGSRTRELRLYHGTILQKAIMRGVLRNAREFLRENPREVIVMMMATGGSGYEDYTRTYWPEHLSEYSDIISTVNTLTPRPTLGQLRGRVLFLYQSPAYWGNPTGIQFYPGNFNFKTNPTWYVQNAYSVFPALASNSYDDLGNVLTTDLEGKYALVLETLNVAVQPTNDKWVINFLSGADGLYPSSIAEYINQRTFDSLTNSTLPTTLNLGTVVMDFPGEGLLARIIASNFRFD